MFSIFKKKEKKQQEEKKVCPAVTACISGQVIPIESVEDEVFSKKVLGPGVAIRPTGQIITAPCDGVISVVMEASGHAVGMTLDNGAELLIHEGIDTVELEGEGFKLYVKAGQRVHANDPLIEFDAEFLADKGYDTTCIIVLTNPEQFPDVSFVTDVDGVQNQIRIMCF